MSYRRLLLAAFFGNCFAVAIAAAVLTFLPALDGRSLVFIIVLLITQTLWSRWYFISFIPFRFPLIDLFFSLSLAVFPVAFVLSFFSLSGPTFSLLAILLATPLWALLMRLVIAEIRSGPAIIGIDPSFARGDDGIYPLARDRQFREAAEKGWEKL